MSFWSGIWDAIKQLFNGFVRILKRIIEGILNFAKHVVNWFKMLNLNPATQTPFIMDAKNLSSVIAKAPKVDCGIFAGVYDNQSETITECEIIEADKFDSTTKSVLRKAEDGIVVLS
jgi:hypothetical protein